MNINAMLRTRFNYKIKSIYKCNIQVTVSTAERSKACTV